MKITWIGHSCFRVETKDWSLVLDPYADGSVPGYRPVRERANQVLCSHEHGDHNARSCVTVVPPAEGAVPLQVTDLPSYHDDVKGAKRGPNTIRLISDGVHRIAHLGDLGCEPEPEQMEALTGLDLLMIPVGGFFTIDAAQAAGLVRELKPKRVIPMHYRSAEGGYDVISTVEPFLREMKNVIRLESAQYTLDGEAPLVSTPLVIVLTPQNGE